MDTTLKPIAYYGTERIELGGQIGYHDLDRKALSAFALTQNGKELLKLHIEEGQRLIWRKREFINMGGQRKCIHLLGWQKTVKGENIQSIAYVFEDGHIEIAGAFRKNHPIFDEVKLKPEEL